MLETINIKTIELYRLLAFFSLISLNNKIDPRTAKLINEGINKQKTKTELKCIFIDCLFLSIICEIQAAKIIIANIEVNIENLPKEILYNSDIPSWNDTA